MSAVTQWEFPVTATPRRRHLQSVPTGPQAAGRRAIARPAAVGRPVRLTRRGRLMLLASGVLALCCLVAMASGAFAGGAAPASRTITVRSGQTLSQVAHAAYPDLAVSDAVAKVQLANQLSSSQLTDGQRLTISK